jgi:hypothetical protein
MTITLGCHDQDQSERGSDIDGAVSACSLPAEFAIAVMG